jgi:branched-chain amino acid transport system permease protein
MGAGALVGGLALGLVVNYQGSGVVNFALGAVAMLGAFEYYTLKTAGQFFVPLPGVPLIDAGKPWSTWSALVMSLLICGVVGALFDVLVLGRLRTSSPLAKLVASLGLLLTLQAIAIQRFGVGGQSAPAVIPENTSDLVHVFGSEVPYDRFIFTGIVIAATILLVCLYRFTRFGLATRAAAENETTAVLTGLAPRRISTANTTIAFVLAGLLGVLIAPTSQLDPTTIPLAVIPAMGAALLARFTSFPIAAASGFAMGVIQSELIYLQTKAWFPTSGGVSLPGVADLLYFVIIMIVLVWRGQGIPTRGALVEPRLPAAPSPQRIALPAALGIVACGLVLVFTSADIREATINTLIAVLLCLSLVVITGLTGQISLIQVGLAGISGLVVSKLAVDVGIGFPVGPLIAIAVATLFWVVFALPAFRVRGVSLAILTVAGMVAIENFVLDNTTWGAAIGGGAPVPEPKFFGLDIGPSGPFPGWHGGVPTPTFGLICLAVVALFGLLVASLRRSPLGQRMLAVRSNERAAAGARIGPRQVKIIAFTLSAIIASVAGVLYGYDFASIAPTQFGTLEALEFVAFAYIGGITTVKGAIYGAMLAPGALIALAMTNLNISPDYLLIIGGLGLMLSVVYLPDGAASVALRDQLPAVFGRYVGRIFRRPVVEQAGVEQTGVEHQVVEKVAS